MVDVTRTNNSSGRLIFSVVSYTVFIHLITHLFGCAAEFNLLKFVIENAFRNTYLDL